MKSIFILLFVLIYNQIGTEEFMSEGSNFYLGLFGNDDNNMPIFKRQEFCAAILPSKESQTSFTVTDAGGTNNYNKAVEVHMSSNANMVNDLSIRNRSVVVISDADHPLSVIAYDEDFISADAYKALACVHLPVENYYEYYAISTPVSEIHSEKDVPYNPFLPVQGRSVLLIISCEDDTEMNITLTQSVKITAPDLLQQVPSGMFTDNVPVSIKLSMAGETLSISCRQDLTGSRVTSDKPLTLISGHECGVVPIDTENCDKLVEQVPPTVTWGNTFITAPIAGRNAHDVFKIVAAQDMIKVTFSCTSDEIQSFNLNRGKFRDVLISSGNYCFVNSTGPILLVQFSLSSDFDKVFEGDPFMVIIPPIEQYCSSYNISLIQNMVKAPESYYVNVLLPNGVDSNGIRMNGQILDPNISFTTISCNGRDSCGLAAQMQVSSGHYSLTHINSSASFNAIVYWASYRMGSGYFAGMTQRPITRK